MGSREEQTAVVVGAGSLGGAAALAIAAGRVGRVVVVERGSVDEADLTAQPALGEAALGATRAAAPARRLARLFPALRVEARDELPDPSPARALVAGADVVVDASNRFPVMFALNDAAVAEGTPLA